MFCARSTRLVQNLRVQTAQDGKLLFVTTAQIVRNKSTAASDDYQFIQLSKRPTTYFQHSLPRLPIPELEKSLKKYLQALEPILTASELQKTKDYVAKFEHGQGAVLQQRLIQMVKEKQITNYISPYWFKMYLSDRKALPINYNPLLVLARADNPEYNTQLVKATNIIISSLRFMRSLRENVLNPEVFYMNPKVAESFLYRTLTDLAPTNYKAYASMAFKAFPLDMSQYHNLFCTTRLPREGIDEIYKDSSARHVLVMRKGHFYAFNVLDESGSIISPKEVAANLKAILNENVTANEVPIGILTTSDRDSWAKTRKYLEDIGNREVLQCIDSAIFVLNLDDEVVDDNYSKLLRIGMHSDGTNRWFDKSLSLILAKDGYVGINFEHSWGDGVAVLRYANDMHDDILKNPKFHPEDVEQLSGTAPNVTKLEFNLDDKVKEIVKTEKSKFDAWTKRLDMNYVIYERFGKDECKKFKVSPDAVMQLAFQLAMYNLTQTFVPTYESCSTAIFKLGRTETIRPCTLDTKAACIAMSKKNDTSMSELKQLLIKCSTTHLNLTKEAALGQGFDRHLFALKKVSEDSHEPLPELFTDPAYDYLNKNILSTSTVSSPAVIAGGFGPTIDNGYGLGYMIQDNRLGTVVTTYRQDYGAADFTQSLRDAFENIHKVLTHK